MNIAELTQKAIEEELAALGGVAPMKRITDVFRENYDAWNNDLFPILRARKKPAHEYLVELLTNAGYKINKNQVAVYMHTVKKEREGLGSKKSSGKKN